MKVYDISMNIDRAMPVYRNKDEKRPSLKVVSDFSCGSVYESRVDMDVHTGTHMDAPLHMLEGGSTIDRVDLSKVVTKCRVLDLTSLEDRMSVFSKAEPVDIA